MLEILIAIFLGIIAGTITGLIPGLHVNLVALSILAGAGTLLSFFSNFSLVCFLISMATTHTFVDFIPSIFLGAPDEDTSLGILPGHKFLLKGKGYFAVKLTVIGSLFSFFIILIMLPIFVLFLQKIYPFVNKYMAFVLIAASCFLILKDKNRLWALILFLMSGLLGFLTLNFYFIKQPVFPLLSGLFGCSLLTFSIIKKTKIPEQKIRSEKIKKKEIFNGISSSAIAGPLCSFLPGLGPAQAAVIGSSFKKLNRKSFLVLLGAINTIVMILGFVALYCIQRPRNGIAIVIQKLIPSLSLEKLLFLIFVSLFVAGIAVLLTLFLGKIFAKNIHKIRYKFLSLGIIFFIIIMCIIFSGFFSLLILLAGTSIGLIANLKRIRRMHLMGCLLLPIIFYFLI